MPSAEQKETLQVGGWKISILFLGWLSYWSKGGSIVGARMAQLLEQGWLSCWSKDYRYKGLWFESLTWSKFHFASGESLTL